MVPPVTPAPGNGTPGPLGREFTREEFQQFGDMLDKATSLHSHLVRNNRLAGFIDDKQFDRFEEIVHNAWVSRSEFMSRFLDPRRDVNAECGYPPTAAILTDAWLYKELYTRDAIANRVIQVLPRETWQVQPVVYEDEDPNVTTEFEDKWNKIGQNLSGEASWFVGQEGNPVWEYILRADVLSRIGSYGILLLGINDGLSLEQPVYGSVVINDRHGNKFTDCPAHPAETRALKSIPNGPPAKSKDPQPLTANELETVEAWERQYLTFNEELTTNRVNMQSGWVGSLTYGGGSIAPGIGGEYKGFVPMDGAGLVPGHTNSIMQGDSHGFMPKDSSGYPLGAGPGKPPNGLLSPGTYLTNPTDYGPSGSGTNWAATGLGRADGVPVPFGGKQYSQGYAVTPEGFAVTPGGYQTTIPASILSGTDQQYFGVQFGPTEQPSDHPGPDHELLFLRPFDESLLQIVRYEWNVRNPRFGLPVMYRVTLNDPREQHSGVGLPMATVFVHWSRVVHLADRHSNPVSSQIYAPPAARPVLNNLLGLQKLYGGSAEMYWRGAFPGLAFETHPELGGDVDIDYEKTKRMMNEYMNGLQRYLTLTGMRARSIAPQVVDPTNQIQVQLTAICVQITVPIRVFTGSERGQLASTQDDNTWNDRLRERQRNYVTPLVIVPFVNRLIQIGVLPQPKKGFKVWWPELTIQTDKEKTIVAVGRTKAMQTFFSSPCQFFMTAEDFYTVMLGFSEEQAKAFCDHIKKNPYVPPPGMMAQPGLGGMPATPGAIPGAVPGATPPGAGGPLPHQYSGLNTPLFGRRSSDQMLADDFHGDEIPDTGELK